MIAHLSGTVAEKTTDAIIIDVGGVGYEVQVCVHDYQAAQSGQPIKLFTYQHIRETAHELFGFSSLTAKQLFEMLISVSGVGPKMALAILGLGDVQAIRNAIAMGDNAFVQRASGVGKRIAERIVVDLKDKVGGPHGVHQTYNPSAPTAQNDDVLDALLALGYTLQQANQALDGVDVSLEPQARIKEALKTL